VEIVKNLMTDARTTGRWYLILAMGRQAGHLALGIGQAAGVTLTLIPEEFPSGPIPLDAIVDVLAGAVIKRQSQGRRDGTAVLAEGLAERLAADDLAASGAIERDEHGHMRLAEINLASIVKTRLQARLAPLRVHPTLVVKEIGYELRCADPIPFDLEYTRALGFCATEYLLEGGSGAMVTLQDGHFVPLPFDRMLDPATGRTRVRLVDTSSEAYRIAREYMLRLRRADFDDNRQLHQLAETAGLSAAAFRAEFGHLVADEPAPVHLAAAEVLEV
jgi:6-phosphofructokinase 1